MKCNINDKISTKWINVLNHNLRSQNVFLLHTMSRRIFCTWLYQIADTLQVPFASALDQCLLCTLWGTTEVPIHSSCFLLKLGIRRHPQYPHVPYRLWLDTIRVFCQPIHNNMLSNTESVFTFVWNFRKNRFCQSSDSFL